MNKKHKIIMSEKERKNIICIFENYHSLIEDKINRFEELISSGTSDINSWIKSKNKKSCVLENQAIALAEDSKLREIISKLQMIEDVLQFYKNGNKINDDIRYKIIKYKYIDKPIDIYKIRDSEVIKHLQIDGHSNIDNKVYYRFKEQILNQTCIFAKELQIL